MNFNFYIYLSSSSFKIIIKMEGRRNWIITHGDADGICAGAIAYSVFKDSNILFSNPVNLLNTLNEIQNDAFRIIISDIAIIENDSKKIEEKIIHLSNKCEIIYVDHHPLPEDFNIEKLQIKFIHEEEACASELIFRFLNDKLNSEMERVMLIGAIADYADNTPFIEKALEKWDKRTLYFEAGILVNGLESFRKNKEDKEKILKFLASGKPPSFHQGLIGAAIMTAYLEEEMRYRIKNNYKKIGEVSYIIDPKGPLGKAATYVKNEGKTLVGIAIDIENNKVDMSIRTSSNKINLNLITKKVAKKFNGSGGGHPSAAGARIPKINLEEFLEEFNKEIEKQLKSN